VKLPQAADAGRVRSKLPDLDVRGKVPCPLDTSIESST
jgi:hypothetical protein